MSKPNRDSFVFMVTLAWCIAILFSATQFTKAESVGSTTSTLSCINYDMSRGERISDAWDEHMMEHPERIQQEVVYLLQETTKTRGLESDLKELAISIANEMKNQGKHKFAIDVFQELINTEQIVGSRGIFLVEAYNNLANAYIAAKDFAHAEEALQTALQLTEEFRTQEAEAKPDDKQAKLKSDNYEVARCLDRLADLQEMQKNYQKELALREKAHNIRLSVYGEGSPFLVESYDNLADLANRLGQKSKAVTLYVEGLKIADHNHPAGSEARELRRKIKALCENKPETPKK